MSLIRLGLFMNSLFVKISRNNCIFAAIKLQKISLSDGFQIIKFVNKKKLGVAKNTFRMQSKCV